MANHVLDWMRSRRRRNQKASQQQSATLSGRRIFILPTRQGLLFVGVLLIILLGATNYANSMMFVLGFWLLSTGLLSMIYCYRNLAGINLRLHHSEACHMGEHNLFQLMFANPGPRPRSDICVHTDKGIKSCDNIDGDSQTVFSLALPAQRRGRQLLGRITISTHYPLGLFRAWSYVDMEAEALVYPAPAMAATAPSYTHQNSGGRDTGETGSDDFHGFRPYQAGDSLRHINWKALAREQGLMTKAFQRHQSPELWFDWQNTPGQEIETRLSLLCRWLLDAEALQQHYGLRLPEQTIQPGRGSQHLQHCLSALALFGEAR